MTNVSWSINGLNNGIYSRIRTAMRVFPSLEQGPLAPLRGGDGDAGDPDPVRPRRPLRRQEHILPLRQGHWQKTRSLPNL